MSLAHLSKLGTNYLWRTPGICHNLASKHSYYTYSLEPSQPIPGRKPCIVDSPAQAVECIKSDQMLFLHAGACTPHDLVKAMTEHAKKNNLKNIKICHMHTEGKADFCSPECKDIFRSISFFIGENVRKAIAEGRADSLPILLHEIPLLFHRKIICPDVALISVSPPDEQGYCSLGLSIDCARAALIHSKFVIAQINHQMPRTFGDGIVHMSHIDVAVCVDTPMEVHPKFTPSTAEIIIGKAISEKLIDNGATLQLGIGNIPDAVLANLHNHKDLGIHSEMFSNGVVDLFEKGCITNNRKKLYQGRIVGSFIVGNKRLYDFVDNNPFIIMLDIYFVNHTKIISQMPKMTAINSTIEIDLTGQCVSDSIGARMYSGFGGQVDFIRGAAEGSDGLGKPIIALQSITKRKESKIVANLKQGAGVVTTRAHVHYVVTEYGIASLFGKTLRQRAYALIHIAHPDHREKLEKDAFSRLKCMPVP